LTLINNFRPKLIHQIDHRFSVYRGSAYLGGKGGAHMVQSNADFMVNLAPQWPEPEEPVSASLANIHLPSQLHEREPFLAPRRHRYASPGRGGAPSGGGAGGGQRGSKESISSRDRFFQTVVSAENFLSKILDTFFPRKK
jgi:hypothetical protein